MSGRHDDELRQLGLAVAYYRKIKGLSQVQLADMAGISRTHMSNLEAPDAVKSISLTTLMDISDALEVPLSKLFSFPSA